MNPSTALTLAAATALFTAAAFIQNRQSADLPSLGPVLGIEEVRGPAAVRPQPAQPPQPEATHVQAVAPSEFRVAGVLVQRRLDMPRPFGSAMPFAGSNAEVRLAIEYTSPTNDLIEWVQGDCKLAAFGDNLGRDLIDPSDALGPFEMLPTLSADKTKLAFTLQSSSGPSRGASSIHAAGTLVVRRASERGVHRSAPIYLETDAYFPCGPLGLEVTKAGPSRWSDGWEVTLQTSDDLGAVVAWAFVDGEGRRVELEPSSRLQGLDSWTQSLTLPAEPLDKGVLEVEVWNDARLEEIEFRVETGISLTD